VLECCRDRRSNSRLDLVETYNDTVEGATKKLKADARSLLTPARWRSSIAGSIRA